MNHFLQTSAWAAFQEARGNKVVRKEGDGWQVVAYLEKGNLSTRLYAPYGPVADSAQALQEALFWLKDKAKALGADCVRVEPLYNAQEKALLEFGLEKVRAVQPEHTQVIDLTQPEEEILQAIKREQRARWRNHQKKGLEIVVSDDPATVTDLIDLLGEVAERNQISVHDAAYFQKQAEVLMPLGAAKTYRVFYEGKVVACSLIYDGANTRYYAHAAAAGEHRKLAPGIANIVQMILDAKKAGLKEFDLYGVVPPEITDHAWSGFSEFKRSFGGKQRDFNGTWELPVNKLKYRGYRAVLAAAEKLRGKK